jgi:AraC-like DNA-binding protein
MTRGSRPADEPAAPDTSFWHRVVSAMLGLGEVIPDGVDGSDQITLGELGAVRIGTLSARRAGGGAWTTRHIRQSNPDICKIDIVAAGRVIVAQDGREARLRPGDLTFVDLSRPAHWSMSPMRAVVVAFPRALLPLRPDELARLTAVRIPGNHGTGALVSTLARQLPEHLDDAGVSHAARLGTAVLDLLTIGMAAHLDRETLVAPPTRQRALLQRIQAFIDENVSDPDLSPARLAEAHHISLRYLHKLFQAQQTTVAVSIRQRRLERCRRDLLDPAQMERPVSAIAARWGILDPTHFSRVFRAAYGTTPAEYRRIHASSVG